MGMFDREQQLKNAPFADGEFVLHDGQYMGTHKSRDFGENHKARVVAGPNRETYIVFGVLAEQIARMEPGDLPATVRIGSDGNAKVFERVESGISQGDGQSEPRW